MDYTTLKTKIATHLNRDDMTAKIPTFVELAIKGLELNCLIPQISSTTIAWTSAGMISAAVPSDFIKAKNVRGYTDTATQADSYPIDIVPWKDIRDDYYRNYLNTSRRGKPLYAAISQASDDTTPALLIFNPIPSVGYKTALYYYRHIGVPAADTSSNFWTLGGWDLAFWASLEEAWRHIGDLEEQKKAEERVKVLLAQQKSQSGKREGRGRVSYIEF